MHKENMKIEDWGYDEFFESGRVKLGLEDFQLARVIAEFKEAYRVKNESGEYLGRITGKYIFNATSREDYPAVGDWVAIDQLSEGEAIIHNIFPRKTIIKRKSVGKNENQIIATNIDTAFVIESVDRDFNLNRFERYFTLINEGGIKPAIILNKIDLVSKEELDLKIAQLRERFKNIDIIITSIFANEGLEALKNYIKKGKTYCFLGSSGVGKSSLINYLLGEERIKTRSIGLQSDRGTHTTTKREMYFLKNGGIVIDNPGMREVAWTDANIGLEKSFDEIASLAKKCKFFDCTHIHEPGCEVLAKVKEGKLDKEKYANYIRLKKEARHYEMTELERKGRDKKFGKLLKNLKKDFKKYNHKDYV